ncbi:hypothetical protein BIV60_15360 [Bacillus sp. MUM 116]|uniref:VirB4 family type IV secretion system protein n=1 Tax=Bacillus sp. MUM 116 TaxID=1678002 RepID=UPI0008F57823|nr:hypothetical protein [Bacillus sp. MUM 116]OIK12900.1 hypothetical protein BIV60_15360 [Bacillus sp. MUM 116]
MPKNILAKRKKQNEESWLDKGHDFMTVRDAIAPSYIEENLEYIKLGENYVRTLVVVDFPNKRKGNWLTKLYRFKENISISYHLEPTSPEKMIDSLNRSIMDLQTRLQGRNALTPQREIETKQEMESSTELLTKIQSGTTSKVFLVHMYLHLQAESLQQLDRITNRLQAILSRAGLKGYTPKFEMLKAFYSVLPTTDNTLPQWTFRTMDSEALSSLFPFDESEIFHPTGVIKGKNKTTESLIVVDQYGLLDSHSEFVVGRTGKGKTFYMLKDMMRYWMQGVQVFSIDPERQFSKVIKRLGGQVIYLSVMSNTIINPMEIRFLADRTDLNRDDDEEVDIHLLYQKIQRLKIFFRLIKKDITPLENALIERYLLKTYEENSPSMKLDTDFSRFTATDYPTLEDFYNKIDLKEHPELKEFKEILWMYVHGSNKRLFNGHTNVNLNGDMICFDLKNLEEEGDSKQAAMYNVLSFLWDEITQREGLKRLYVDEAHVLCDSQNPRAMKFLYQIYKRIRKYKGGATVATQQIADYLSAIEGNRNYGEAIIANSTCQMIMGLSSLDLDDIKQHRVLDLSEQEGTILLKAKRGEGIYVVDTDRVHIQVDHTPEEMEIIDPENYQLLYGNGKAV